MSKFTTLQNKIEKQSNGKTDATEAAAIAASVGRAKYGAKGMALKAKVGERKAARAK